MYCNQNYVFYIYVYYGNYVNYVYYITSILYHRSTIATILTLPADQNFHFLRHNNIKNIQSCRHPHTILLILSNYATSFTCRYCMLNLFHNKLAKSY